MFLGLSFTYAQKNNGPEFKFQETVHDFGKVKKGGNTTHDFEFKNVGNKPIVITNVSSSCGCTIPEWPKTPIAPGKSGNIKVKYDNNKVGPINRSIFIQSNAVNTESNERFELKIKGEITN